MNSIAVHVRYKSLFISLPSSAKQQREMAKFCVIWRMSATTANFPNLYSEVFTVSQIQFRNSSHDENATKHGRARAS